MKHHYATTLVRTPGMSSSSWGIRGIAIGRRGEGVEWKVDNPSANKCRRIETRDNEE